MKTIALLILVLIGAESFSQNDFSMSGELSKYWFYRWRLRNDFMVMGSEQGQSLIIDSRNTEGFPIAKWSDGSILHGYYLSMLASEHAILQAMNRTEDLKNNERELYFAIKAYERLDFNSETFYSNNPDITKNVGWDTSDAPQSGSVNGYVYRDDVPPTFISNDPKSGFINAPTSNYYKLNNKKTGVKYGNMFYNVGDYEDLWKPCEDAPNGNYFVPPILSDPHLPIVHHKKGRGKEDSPSEEKCYGIAEMSQDQVIRLLLGFQMIVWSIPSQVYFIDTDNDGINDVSMNFSSEARRHATNLIGRVSGYLKGTCLIGSNTVQYVPFPSQALGPNSFWVITEPRHHPTSLGSAITGYMPPMQIISQFLFTPSNDLGIIDPLYARASPFSYHSQLWESAWFSGIFGYNGSGNAKMSLLLSVLSKSGNPSIYTMGRHIYERSKKNGEFSWHPFYVPLYDYIWGWDPTLQGNKDRKEQCYSEARFRLALAPCIGPYNFSNPVNFNDLGTSVNSQFVPSGFPYLWNTPMMWDHKASEWDLYATSNESIGFFNGIDYMMLYNLVYANSTETRPMYHDLINRVVDYPINSDNVTNLNKYSGNGYLIGAFENMKLRSSVTGSKKLEFKALDYVLIESGAIIEPSGNGSVLIYTDTIKCTPDNLTDWNTPYKSAKCETCDMDNMVGEDFVPTHKKMIKSLRKTLELETDYNLMFNNTLDDERVENFNQKSIVVYPNPIDDLFSIYCEDELVKITILTTLGQPIKTIEDISDNYSLSELSRGIYLLEVVTIKNERYVVEISKN
jgi:hypothetical protein